MSLQTIALMKEALDKEGLKPHLMAQPICYHAPDVGPKGFVTLPEISFGELSSFSVPPLIQLQCNCVPSISGWRHSLIMSK